MKNEIRSIFKKFLKEQCEPLLPQFRSVKKKIYILAHSADDEAHEKRALTFIKDLQSLLGDDKILCDAYTMSPTDRISSYQQQLPTCDLIIILATKKLIAAYEAESKDKLNSAISLAYHHLMSHKNDAICYYLEKVEKGDDINKLFPPFLQDWKPLYIGDEISYSKQFCNLLSILLPGNAKLKEEVNKCNKEISKQLKGNKPLGSDDKIGVSEGSREKANQHPTYSNNQTHDSDLSTQTIKEPINSPLVNCKNCISIAVAGLTILSSSSFIMKFNFLENNKNISYEPDEHRDFTNQIDILGKPPRDNLNIFSEKTSFVERRLANGKLIIKETDDLFSNFDRVFYQGSFGSGKTIAAMHYFYLCQTRNNTYSMLIWCPAESKEILSNCYNDIVKVNEKFFHNVGSFDENIEKFRAWLQNKKNWLMVLDNAGIEDELNTFLPGTKFGKLLFNTRLGWNLSSSINIEQMQPSEARELFRKVLNNAFICTDRQIDDLIDNGLLSRLPLVLVQAASTIRERHRKDGFTLERYLNDIRNIDNELIKNGKMPPLDIHKSIWLTWQKLYEQITAEYLDLPIKDIVNHIAYLNPTNISSEFICSTVNYAKISQANCRETLDALDKYSVIKLVQGSFTIHGTVQKLVRLNHSPQDMEMILSNLNENFHSYQSDFSLDTINHLEYLNKFLKDNSIKAYHHSHFIALLGEAYNYMGEYHKAINFLTEEIKPFDKNNRKELTMAYLFIKLTIFNSFRITGNIKQVSDFLENYCLTFELSSDTREKYINGSVETKSLVWMMLVNCGFGCTFIGNQAKSKNIGSFLLNLTNITPLDANSEQFIENYRMLAEVYRRDKTDNSLLIANDYLRIASEYLDWKDESKHKKFKIELLIDFVLTNSEINPKKCINDSTKIDTYLHSNRLIKSICYDLPQTCLSLYRENITSSRLLTEQNKCFEITCPHLEFFLHVSKAYFNLNKYKEAFLAAEKVYYMGIYSKNNTIYHTEVVRAKEIMNKSMDFAQKCLLHGNFSDCVNIVSCQKISYYFYFPIFQCILFDQEGLGLLEIYEQPNLYHSYDNQANNILSRSCYMINLTTIPFNHFKNICQKSYYNYYYDILSNCILSGIEQGITQALTDFMANETQQYYNGRMKWILPYLARFATLILINFLCNDTKYTNLYSFLMFSIFIELSYWGSKKLTEINCQKASLMFDYTSKLIPYGFFVWANYNYAGGLPVFMTNTIVASATYYGSKCTLNTVAAKVKNFGIFRDRFKTRLNHRKKGKVHFPEKLLQKKLCKN